MLNRVIKFRAWDGEQMISPDYVDRQGRGHWKSNSIPVCTGVNSPDALMQSIGLKDTKGVEVYEGDIVLYSTGSKYSFSRTPGEVIWDVEGAEFRILVDRPPSQRGLSWSGWRGSLHCKVIGNIYENPALLTEGK